MICTLYDVCMPRLTKQKNCRLNVEKKVLPSISLPARNLGKTCKVGSETCCIKFVYVAVNIQH